MTPPHDTIFALSSGRPPAAIAVIRISGPNARDALEKTIGRVPEPRRATLAKVRDPQTGEVIDEGLALWFPAPKSETGEDMAELQVHGGRAVIAGVLAALGKLAGFRHAEAGEFTRRAFENGRMDLTAVEGLADLVAAETQAQRRQALAQMQGAFARQLERWREKLIAARALLEAGIDFSDEGDVPATLAQEALAIIGPVLGEIGAGRAGHGERLREGLQVAIAGPPNVGKSTLLNRIAQRDVAIVSPYAGTTRDVIEVHLDLGGFPVTLFDTAGIRATRDPVEQEGVRRAQASARAADLVLWVLDARAVDADAIASAIGPAVAGQSQVWLVANKADLLDPPARARMQFMLADGGLPDGERNPRSVRPRASGDEGAHAEQVAPGFPLARERTEERSRRSSGNGVTDIEPGPVEPSGMRARSDTVPVRLISAATGAGVDSLVDAIKEFAGKFFWGETALVTRARHRQQMGLAFTALADALTLAETDGTEGREELIAEQVRMATRALERLTGRVDVEDILAVIFRDFCIGK